MFLCTYHASFTQLSSAASLTLHVQPLAPRSNPISANGGQDILATWCYKCEGKWSVWCPYCSGLTPDQDHFCDVCHSKEYYPPGCGCREWKCCFGTHWNAHA